MGKMGTNHLVAYVKVGQGERTAIFNSSFVDECWPRFLHYGIGDIEWFQGLLKN